MREEFRPYLKYLMNYDLPEPEPEPSSEPLSLADLMEVIQGMIGQPRTQEGSVSLVEAGEPIPDPMKPDVGDLVDQMNETGGPLRGLYGGGTEINPRGYVGRSRRRGR